MEQAVLLTHPFLDPNLSVNSKAIFRHLQKSYLGMKESKEAYNKFLNQMLHPLGVQRPLESNLVSAGYYMNEATHYMRELLVLFPASTRDSIAPLPEVERCSDILELMDLIFGSSDRRLSFEAQRKLHLTKLFFDVDHCLEVQRGVEHKEYFEGVLEREIFSHLTQTRKVEICYSIRPDGESMEYSIGRLRPGQECWPLDLREIEMKHEGRPLRLHVYFYSCRFKREVIPYQYERGLEHYDLGPSELWPGLTKRRSASIVSKMIRKAESDPRAIPDLIGCMFIVENLTELEHLREVLFDLLGGVFRIRSVVDTVSRSEDRSLLNPHSGPGYKVYKSLIDILYRPEQGSQPSPYLFTVELQLYTLENYLRTIHSSHYASHQALKRRQFLQGLVPALFPVEIYGQELVRRVLDDAGVPAGAKIQA